MTADPLRDVLTDTQRAAYRACHAPGEMPIEEFADETNRVKGTVGNHLVRAKRKLATAADAFADAATPVDFETEARTRSTSWQRADEATRPENIGDTEIEAVNRFAWTVRLPGGKRHLTALLHREDWFEGYCDCKGFEYNDGPCAHLCTLRQAAFVHVETADGDRVRIPEQPANRTPATDGGRVVEPAAGHDGREFGRPEDRL